MSDTSTPAPTPTKKPAQGNGLQHRIGPLPVWGWVVVAIGAIIIYKIIKSHSAASTSTAAASGTVGAANNALGMFGTEGFSTNSAGEVIDNATGDILGTFGGATGGSGSTASTTTFAQWEANAQQTLFGLGYDSPSVNTALQNYAAGGPLSPGDFGIIEAAIRLTGNPPSGIGLPTELQPTAAPSAPAAPAQAAAPLAQIDANAWPLIVKFGQDANAATDFTQIGQIVNGQYHGQQVADGAPVYAGVLGGYAQGTNFATLPNGTAIYIPTTLATQGYASQAA